MAAAGKRRRAWITRAVVALAVVAVIALVSWRGRQPKPVEVVRPQMRAVVQTLTASGRVKGAQEAELSVEQPGVIVEVLVQEGDPVAVDEVVARLSQDVVAAQLTQAEASIRTAQAQLDEAMASAGTLGSSIEQAQAEVEGSVRQAEERLTAAEARLAELRAGGRVEEREEAAAAVTSARAQVEQATHEVERASSLAQSDATAMAALEHAQAAERDVRARLQQAQAAMDQAERDLKRIRQLHDQGVLPQADLERGETSLATARQTVAQAQAQVEQAQVEVSNQRRLLEVTRETELQRRRTELQVAQQSLEAALARQRLVQAGAREELIAQQRAEVDAARAALRAAREAGRARIETIVGTPAAERVRVAQRRLEEATSARDTLLAQLRSTEVKARFSGVVTDIVKRPGDAVSPGQPIMLLAEMAWPEVHLEIDERDIALVREGLAATMVADAYPDRPFAGSVVRVGPRAVPERGIMDVVLRPNDRVEWLRSGMTVDASIVIAEREQLLVVPTEAIVRIGEKSYVMTVEDGVVRRREVQTGTAGIEGTVIVSGVNEDSQVVVSPTSVKPDQQVRPVEAAGDTEERSGI